MNESAIHSNTIRHKSSLVNVSIPCLQGTTIVAAQRVLRAPEKHTVPLAASLLCSASIFPLADPLLPVYLDGASLCELHSLHAFTPCILRTLSSPSKGGNTLGPLPQISPRRTAIKFSRPMSVYVNCLLLPLSSCLVPAIRGASKSVQFIKDAVSSPSMPSVSLPFQLTLATVSALLSAQQMATALAQTG